MATEKNEPVVRMSGIVKQFPGVLANNNVSFELLPGEIHALLGENGAGKSTLMNILYGLYDADEGNIEVFGKKVHFSSARNAIANGLGMVHQHFMLVKPFTVAENVILGQPSPRFPMTEDLDEVVNQLLELSKQYGLAIDPAAQIWTLSVGEQQRVEILKALHRGAEILILDEPTAVLTPQEVEELVAILQRLAAEGKSIVFISHKLDEVLAVSDRITVLRDGSNVDTVATCDTDKAGLARMMVGRDVLLKVQKNSAHPEDVVLKVTDLKAENDREFMALRGIDFEVRAGEILGIAGVAGNGQTELEEVIAGLREVSSGQVFINDKETTHCSPREIGKCGLAHIPSDRYRMGMLKDFTVTENLVLQRISDPPFTKRFTLQWEEIRCEARQLVKDYDVRTPSIEVMAGNLSGGNAQKMVLARELSRNPQVLIAAQPTRGLDVSAIEYVHKTLVEKRDAGMAILLISTELDEIFNLSDRIAVMYEGEIIGIMDREEADLYTIGLMMAGGHAWQDEAERLQCD